MQEEPSTEQLLFDVQRLSAEVENLKRQKADLEILLDTTTEHSDTIEAQLASLVPTAGVTRGEIVSDLQQPLQVPVGDRLLGRMLNLFGFFGEAIDRKEPIAGGEWRSIHAEPALDRYQEMEATGVLKNAVLVFGQMNEPVYGFDR